MKAICITDELDYYDKGVKYEVYRWEKEDDNIWIKDNLGNSDCYGEKAFLMQFKWI